VWGEPILASAPDLCLSLSGNARVETIDGYIGTGFGGCKRWQSLKAANFRYLRFNCQFRCGQNADMHRFVHYGDVAYFVLPARAPA
jgi:hypothetical protein